jgi:hypothetical protein
MDSMNDNLEATRRRARRRYEWTRARQALLGFLPVLVPIGIACTMSGRPSWALGFGLSLFAVGVSVLWYGRELRRAVLPGLAAGAAPLLLVAFAPHFGHTCDGLTCTSLCLVACAVGGALAGFFIGTRDVVRRGGIRLWAVTSAVAVLTGALACARLGGAGLFGLVLGFVAGSVPGLARRLFKPTA